MGYDSEISTALSLIEEAGTSITIQKKNSANYYQPLQSYYTSTAKLNGSISSTATHINIDTISSAFAGHGTIGIEQEAIYYGSTNATGDILKGCVRSSNYTRAFTHSDNSNVYLLGPAVYATYFAYGVFLNYKEEMIEGKMIQIGDKKALIAASGLSIDIDPGDVIISNSTEWNVISSKLLAPDDSSKILFTCQIRG